MAGDWNTTPSFLRASAGCFTTSMPNTSTVPDVGASSVLMIRNSVVLPPPLGPSMANRSPDATEKLRPRNDSRSA